MNFAKPLPPGLVVTGRITEIIRSRACGFIRAADGQQVFFHASDVVDADFAEMRDRVAVQFTLIPDSVSGPRAAKIRIDRQAAARAAR